MDTVALLWGTVLLRPYVFVFLALYLTIAILDMGIVRSVIFTVLAYSIAFLSEYSSTRNGFPYGFYSYIDTTRGQELWISNVPFMDSLSYSFLSYISYTVSRLLWTPLKRKGWDIRWDETGTETRKDSVRVILTGAVLFMLMDVIIDPVAFHGDRWFLGKIYTYREEGEYFHIPLTNFAGWFLVGTAILASFRAVTRWLDRKRPLAHPRSFPFQALLGPGLFFGVLLFNLAVTFYIGEILLGFCGVAISLGIFLVIVFRIRHPEKFGF
ncbi:MAG: carotenoid biosynthesis protein [Nitrospinaceae bacterium]